MDDSVILQHSDEEAYFGVEAVSSPVSTVKRYKLPFIGRGIIQETPTKQNDNVGCILVHATPTPTKVQYAVDEIPSPIFHYGDGSDCDLDEEDAEQVRVNVSRTKVIMNGWRERWALKKRKSTGFDF